LSCDRGRWGTDQERAGKKTSAVEEPLHAGSLSDDPQAFKPRERVYAPSV
jgi:hypothetical protein